MKQNIRTHLKVILNLLIFVVIVLLCMFLLPKVLVFFMPFVVAGIIALIANPIVRFCEEKLKIKRKAGTAVVIIAVIAIVTLMLYLVVAILAEQIVNFAKELPDMWASLQADLTSATGTLNRIFVHFPEDIRTSVSDVLRNLSTYIGSFFSNMGQPTFTAIGNFAKNIPGVVIGIIMCLLASYFFVAEKDYLPRIAAKCLPASILKRWILIRESMKKAVGGYFKAQLKIEVWIYLLLAIGLTVLNVRFAFFIAIGIAILDVLPFLGTGCILMPWAVIKFLSADYTSFIGLLIIWGVGQLVRQMIQPKIVGDSIGMPAIPTLFLLYAGYRIGGVIGMIIAVPIGIIVLNMYEEGVFDTAKDSVRILFATISNFRHIDDQDMEAVRIYQEIQKKKMEELAALKQQEEQERQKQKEEQERQKQREGQDWKKRK